MKNIVEHFEKFGVPERVLCERLGIEATSEMKEEHLAKLRSWYGEFQAAAKLRRKNLETIRIIRESLNIKPRGRK